MTTLHEAPATVLRSEPVLDGPPPSGGGAGQVDESTRVGISQVLIVTSLLTLWAFTHLVVFSDLQHAHTQRSLYAEIRSQLAEGTAPLGAPIASGAPVAVMDVPAIGISGLVVVEGSRPADLQSGPGHVLGSVLPGQQGVSILAGRSLTHGAPFANISDLEPGTVIEVTTGQGRFVYGVQGVRREGDPAPDRLADGGSRLTLVTSAREDGALASLRAGETVYVDATLTDGAVGPGPRSTRDPDTRLMETGTDAATLAQLALCLQLLALALVGSVWAWNRWSRAAAVMVGTPCVVAALWLTSTIGSRLLPGLL